MVVKFGFLHRPCVFLPQATAELGRQKRIALGRVDVGLVSSAVYVAVDDFTLALGGS